MKFAAGSVEKEWCGRRAHQERNQFLHTLLLEATTPSRIRTYMRASYDSRRNALKMHRWNDFELSSSSSSSISPILFFQDPFRKNIRTTCISLRATSLSSTNFPLLTSHLRRRLNPVATNFRWHRSPPPTPTT